MTVARKIAECEAQPRAQTQQDEETHSSEGRVDAARQLA